MVNWKEKLKGNPIPWLLETDKNQPAVRYFTLRDIIGTVKILGITYLAWILVWIARPCF